MRKRIVRTAYVDLSAEEVHQAIKFWLEDKHGLYGDSVDTDDGATIELWSEQESEKTDIDQKSSEKADD